MRFLVHLLVSTVAVLLAAYLLPGVIVSSFGTAMLVAIVFGFLNSVVKPILAVLTLPITIVTLGLFYLVLNILMVFATDAILNGFSVSGPLAALLFSLLVSIFSSIAGAMVKEED